MSTVLLQICLRKCLCSCLAIPWEACSLECLRSESREHALQAKTQKTCCLFFQFCVFRFLTPLKNKTGFVFCGPGFEAGEAFGPVLIAAARLIGKVSATSGVANVDPTAVSSIEAEQQRYSRDELNCTGTVTAGLGVVLLEGVDYIQANQQRFDYPTLLFYGKHDTLVNKAGIERFYEAAKNSDKTLLVFENSRHEVFYDVDSEEAMKKVIDWLVTRSK